MESPADLESLLEVCLSDTDRQWSDLVDYLVTLLATVETDGRKQIDRYPASVSPRLSELCAAAVETATAEGTKEAEELAERIDDACESLARGEPIGELVQQIRELKRESENLLLFPRALKSVVSFNVAVNNRMLQQQEVRRSLHQAELEVISESEPVGELDSNALPAFGSFELAAVETALHDCLLRGPTDDGPAHRVVAAFELSKLSGFERDAFAQRSNAQVSRIVRTVVTIGLIVRHCDEVSDDLEQLGIDGEWLRRSSAGEIDKLAQSGIRELTRDSSFIEAQQLAELRARYLNPLFDEDLLIRAAVSSGTAAPQSAIAEPGDDDPAARAEKRSQRAKPKRHAEIKRRKKPKARKKPAKGEGRSGNFGVMVGLVLVAAVASLVLMNRGDGPRNETHYDNSQLALISPYLSSGYTTTDGVRTTFTGTVNQMWSRVPSMIKKEEALAIGAMMQKQNIAIVMFFDMGRKLQFHYAAGRVRHLE